MRVSAAAGAARSPLEPGPEGPQKPKDPRRSLRKLASLRRDCDTQRLPQRGVVLADAVEALIGAVLLDGGPEAAEALIDLLFASEFATLPGAEELKDAKTRLQEWLQGNGYRLPSYAVETVRGRDHEQTFVVSCTVEERDAHTTGQGSSRRHAEQEAAATMLSVLTGERD